MEQIDIEPSDNKPKKTNKNSKTRTIVTIVIGVVAVVVGVALVCSVIFAGAKTTKKQNYLTYENYAKIEVGMTYEQVVDIFGGMEGKLDSEIGSEGDFYNSKCYMWKSEDDFIVITVTFVDGTVHSKYQIGL